MVNKENALATAIALICTTAAFAGDLNAPSAPTDPGSAMYPLEDIYNRLDAGTPGIKRSGSFVEPTAGPASTGRTLDEVMSKAPVAADINGVSRPGVLAGETYWSLRTDGTWGPQAGTMINNGTAIFYPGTADQPMGGYYTDSSKVIGEANLVAGNIKNGITIFGVAGKTEVVDTTSGDAIAADLLTGKKAWVDGSEITGSANISAYPALVSRTGQTTCYNAAGTAIACTGTGQDGDVLAGEAWPNPRFTDNSNGTVTDNLTGLVWLKNASCFGARNRTTALSDANSLANGACGLTDGSTAGDWHLPNKNELNSLLDSEYYNPPLSDAAGTAQHGVTPANDAFSGVVSDFYWSSTTFAAGTNGAWIVNLNFGNVGFDINTNSYYVWPVRGGQ